MGTYSRSGHLFEGCTYLIILCLGWALIRGGTCAREVPNQGHYGNLWITQYDCNVSETKKKRMRILPFALKIVHSNLFRALIHIKALIHINTRNVIFKTQTLICELLK